MNALYSPIKREKNARLCEKISIVLCFFKYVKQILPLYSSSAPGKKRTNQTDVSTIITHKLDIKAKYIARGKA